MKVDSARTRLLIFNCGISMARSALAGGMLAVAGLISPFPIGWPEA